MMALSSLFVISSVTQNCREKTHLAIFWVVYNFFSVSELLIFSSDRGHQPCNKLAFLSYSLQTACMQSNFLQKCWPNFIFLLSQFDFLAGTLRTSCRFFFPPTLAEKVLVCFCAFLGPEPSFHASNPSYCLGSCSSEDTAGQATLPLLFHHVTTCQLMPSNYCCPVITTGPILTLLD